MSDPHPPVTPERINQLTWGYAGTMILETAVRHKLFDAVDSGSKTIDELVSATGASHRGLSVIANALIGLGFLTRDVSGRYANTPESALFLVSTKPSFQGGIVRHASRQLVPAWLRLHEAVASGKPVQEVDHQAEGEEFFQQFVADIFPSSFPAAKALAAKLNLAASPNAKALDLAAGSGVWGIALAQSAPSLHVTAVDFAGVLPVTRDFVNRFELAARFRFVAGNIHETDLGTGYTVATLGHILHSEGEARSRKLLERAFDALAPGGTIAIAEFLVNADRTGPPGSLIFAVNMFLNTTHGDTYSFEEISAWLEGAGFVDPRLLDAPGPSPLILATKPA